jgi:hypothetical protein
MFTPEKRNVISFFEGLVVATTAHAMAWLAMVSASIVWQWVGHVAGVLIVYIASAIAGH